MARLQDFQTVTPTSSDKLLVVQSQGQGLNTIDAIGAYMANNSTVSSLNTTSKKVSGAINEIRGEMFNTPTIIDLTLENNVENYSFSSYYYKKMGRVTINMSIKSLTTSPTTVATLPAGFRPRLTTSFSVSDGTATGSCGVNISAAGKIQIYKSSTQYAIGEISFDAFN